jgi:hypothetical protein
MTYILRLLQYIIPLRSPSVVPHLRSLYAHIDVTDCRKLGDTFSDNIYTRESQ